jgi:glycerol-3-phosphate dehydrogenase
MKKYDVVIIGAGVIGCAIARELSRYQVNIAVLEKENDVSCGASKANSGIVHGGFDAKAGTRKGYFSRRGNRMYAKLDEELHFGYLECGSLVLAYNEEDYQKLLDLKDNGEKNGVDDLQILNREEVIAMEPHVSEDVKHALYCPSSGVTSPYELTIALCDNAIQNGVDVFLNTEVVNIDLDKDGEHDFCVVTKEEIYHADYIVNAAGVFSDRIAKMLGIDDFYIIPRKGEYILLDKKQGHLAQHVLFQTPSHKGKGILVTRTYHGNLMLGPNAQEVDTRDEIGTNEDVLKYIVGTARHSVPDFDMRFMLTSFAGLRATSSTHDFIVGRSKVPGFIQAAGIESPGLTSSPAIAKYIAEELSQSGLELIEDPSFNPNRPPIIQKQDKDIVCLCEQVSKSEIIDALSRGLYIDHIDGVKRRTRATMGSCQGHRCREKVATIIAEYHGIDKEEVTLRGKGSFELPPREDRMFWKKLNQSED